MKKFKLINELQDVVEKQIAITDILIEATQTLIEEIEKCPKVSDLKQIKRLDGLIQGSQYLSKRFTEFADELINR